MDSSQDSTRTEFETKRLQQRLRVSEMLLLKNSQALQVARNEKDRIEAQQIAILEGSLQQLRTRPSKHCQARGFSEAAPVLTNKPNPTIQPFTSASSRKNIHADAPNHSNNTGPAKHDLPIPNLSRLKITSLLNPAPPAASSRQPNDTLLSTLLRKHRSGKPCPHACPHRKPKMCRVGIYTYTACPCTVRAIGLNCASVTIGGEALEKWAKCEAYQEYSSQLLGNCGGKGDHWACAAQPRFWSEKHVQDKDGNWVWV